jgi:hypothetical protein
MKHTLMALVLSSLVLFGCGLSFDSWGFGERIEGSGNIITEDRAVSDFTRVEILGSGELIVTQGDHYALTVETDDNLMEYVKTEVQGRTLKLSFTEEARNKNLQPTRGFVFRVTLPDLEDLVVAGSADISAERLESERLAIIISGSGDVRIDELISDDLTVQIIGSGDIEIAGVAAQQSFSILGSGSIDTGDLRGETVDVTIPGSGSATVWATDELRVTIAGSGNVGYYGSPTVTHSILGTGNISSLGDK